MASAETLERVAFDASVLLGSYRAPLIASAALHYCVGYWSSWIVSEFVRKRTEWIAERALREGCTRAETRRRLRDSRQRVNALIANLSQVLYSVDYALAPPTDLSWLIDSDDWPVIQTALAASATVLVTDNARDFPLGETREGILILGSTAFLSRLDTRFPNAQAAIREYLGGPLFAS